MTLPKRPELKDPIPQGAFSYDDIASISAPYWDSLVGTGLEINAEGTLQLSGLPSTPATTYLYGPNGFVGVGAGLEISLDGYLVVVD